MKRNSHYEMVIKTLFCSGRQALQREVIVKYLPNMSSRPDMKRENHYEMHAKCPFPPACQTLRREGHYEMLAKHLVLLCSPNFET